MRTIAKTIFLVLFLISFTFCIQKKENDKNDHVSESATGYDAPNPISLTEATPETFYELPDTISLPLVERADSLRVIFQMLQENKDPGLKHKYEKLFFQLFPSNYQMYLSFRVSPDQVKLFSHLKSINTRDYINKIIGISVDAKWQYAMHFQYYALNLNFPDNVSIFCELLSECTNEEIYNFWYFFFEGPHPSNMKKDYEMLYPKVKAINANIARLMSQAFEKLLSEEDHGH